MPGLSDVALCSLALGKLGEEPFESFTDENDNATRAGRVYPPLRDAILSEYPWRFAIVERRMLTRDSAAPDAGWRYSFQLPPDRASHGAFAAYQSASVGARPLKHFTIAGDRLLADDAAIWLTYTRKITEADFPPYFVNFLASAYAAEIALATTGDKTDAVFWRQVAYGSQQMEGEGGLKQTAKEIDSQSHPNDAIDDAESFDLLTARMS